MAALLGVPGCRFSQDPPSATVVLEEADRAQPSSQPAADEMTTSTPEPDDPTIPSETSSTRKSSPGPEGTSNAARSLTETPAITATPAVEQTAAAESRPFSFASADLARFGVTISRFNADAEAAHVLGLPFGSTLNWNVTSEIPEVPAEFWQVVRVSQEGIRRTSWESIEEVLVAYPGSYWIVGNEPDVQWQDNVAPQRYAEIYHEVYHFIKDRDPDARVVIGGVSQPTPLRRAYLDLVLGAYQSTYGEKMPVDVWNVHAFILREEEDSWGVGIPPGMTGEEGILYEIEDHDDVDILAQNIRDFRKWMQEHGYGDKPLVVSEYGILMPEDYGFPPERTSAFMKASFDLFRTMEGEEGYVEDENRLVQWWFWYSLYDGLLYSTGNLWDAETGLLTELGQTWTSYITDSGIVFNTEKE